MEEGGSLPGLESGFLSDTWKCVVRGEECCPSESLYWEGLLGQRAGGEGNGENCSATCLTVSGFMVIGLVSGLSFASHSELRSFLGAHASLSRDGFQ